jgi:PIN domain nuclease of toxin-antitoxin system
VSHLADACALLAYLGAGGRGMSEAGLAAMRGSPFVSPITVWELMHKAGLGKLPPMPTEGGSFVRHLVSIGFRIETFGARDAEIAASLPPLHRDPMDRMLIGTAKRAAYAIITCDAIFAEYDVRTVW